MKIIIVDDDGFELTSIAPSDGEITTGTIRVSWNDDLLTHRSAYDAAQEIISQGPDVVFLDHDLGYKSQVWGRPPETGADVARILRDQGFTGRLIGTSSKDQPYCDAKSGKVRKKPLSWLVEFARPVLTTENKV